MKPLHEDQIHSPAFQKISDFIWSANKSEEYILSKAHKFTMALKGQGKDAARQWEAVTLGSIPILTDCIEMRFFEDMPVVYCPNDVNNLTEEYLGNQIVGTNTDKIRFSYWESHIKNMRDDLRI